MNLRFFHCSICGKVIAILSDTGIPTHCCGRAMRELVPNRTDGAVEKHVPVLSVTGNAVSVQVGGEPHPMTGSHSITWIGLRTSKGFQFRELHPGDSPAAGFSLPAGDPVKAGYAYCNLHGLWCSDWEADSESKQKGGRET